MKTTWLVAWMFVFAMSGLGCQRHETPERVAIAFLELYVLRVDQKSALELADDLAAEKLRKELADVQSARATGGDYASDPRRPAIRRELVQTVATPDGGILYTFRLEVRPKGGTPTYQRMLIQVRRRGEKWRVVDFQMWSDEKGTESPHGRFIP